MTHRGRGSLEPLNPSRAGGIDESHFIVTRLDGARKGVERLVSSLEKFADQSETTSQLKELLTASSYFGILGSRVGSDS